MQQLRRVAAGLRGESVAGMDVGELFARAPRERKTAVNKGMGRGGEEGLRVGDDTRLNRVIAASRIHIVGQDHADAGAGAQEDEEDGEDGDEAIRQADEERGDGYYSHAAKRRKGKSGALQALGLNEQMLLQGASGEGEGMAEGEVGERSNFVAGGKDVQVPKIVETGRDGELLGGETGGKGVEDVTREMYGEQQLNGGKEVHAKKRKRRRDDDGDEAVTTNGNASRQDDEDFRRETKRKKERHGKKHRKEKLTNVASQSAVENGVNVTQSHETLMNHLVEDRYSPENAHDVSNEARKERKKKKKRHGDKDSLIEEHSPPQAEVENGIAGPHKQEPPKKKEHEKSQLEVSHAVHVAKSRDLVEGVDAKTKAKKRREERKRRKKEVL